MCGEQYMAYAPRRLGLGEGQYLMTSDEVPAAVYEAEERALEYWAPMFGT